MSETSDSSIKILNRKMARPRKLYTICSLLMAALFAYSASVQLNDPDWYFWFPLYVAACVVNLVSWTISSKRIKQVAEAALWLGVFLFIKAAAENFANGVSGFWSLDLSERVIRETVGSGLVIISMVLQLIASSSSSSSAAAETSTQKRTTRYVEYGMGILVGFSYALPFVFFVVQKGEMKF